MFLFLFLFLLPLCRKLLRMCRHGQQPGGQKAQRHQQGQSPRKEALEVLFHSFFSPLIFLFCLSPSRRGRRARERQKRDMGQGAASLPHVGSIFTFAGAAAPSSLSLRQGVTVVGIYLEKSTCRTTTTVSSARKPMELSRSTVTVTGTA